MNHPESYYRRVILCYLVGDAEHLLEIKERRSGILMAPAITGIDALGGAILGFDAAVGKRSVYVMETLFQYPKEIAEFLYQSLRCGLVHQGTAKYGTKFFSDHGNFNRPSPVYRDTENWLWIDCVKITEDFVKAATTLWKNERASIKHCPPIEIAGHEKAALLNLPSFLQYLGDVGEASACTNAKLVAGKWIRTGMTSFSHADPTNHFSDEMVIEIPPTIC